MKALRHINWWTTRLGWLSIVLLVTLLATIGLPVAIPTNSVQASPDTWTQTTVADSAVAPLTMFKLSSGTQAATVMSY